MTAFDYTTGNQGNLIAGGPASMSDIQGSFTDLKIFLNGGLIDATNLATSAKPITLMTPYRTIFDGSSTAAVGGLGIVVFLPTSNGSLTWPSNAGGALQSYYINPADYAVSGLTARFRLVSHVANGSVVPASNFTFGLYPVNAPTGSAGTFVFTVGTVVSGSTTLLNNPAANSNNPVVSADFALGSAGLYVPGMANSASPAANTSFAWNFMLQVHWV
jgi:hypothetical protein